MPKKEGIRKVLLLGSGPIVIGQAAEFDYSGTQACRALREEGVEVVLVNSNPATIQTDPETADKIYLEPLTKETVAAIIERERPDGIIATMSGQTGLNLAVELRETLERFGVSVLGTPIESIELAEDREKFKKLMISIGEPVPESLSCSNRGQMAGFIEKEGLPVMLRADFALGGASSGIANTMKEADRLFEAAGAISPSGAVLVEKSLGGLGEIEYEVIRDASDNCIAVCNMENVDPVGVHTGESIVVAPSQTLSDREYQMLRSAAIKIIRALKVEGACNVQFALDQSTGRYFVIEVNPRASRSSALASKATGYPIAKVATRIALGYALPEIRNDVTGKTACFEPSLDYVVVKIPRWPFDKFALDGPIGTQMKSTGEAMAIGRSFEEALGKALRSLEMRPDWRQKTQELSGKPIGEALAPSEFRIQVMLKLLEDKTAGAKAISSITKINEWFVDKLQNIARIKAELAGRKLLGPEDAEIVRTAKRSGFSDRWVCEATGRSADYVRLFCRTYGIKPAYKMVDTCSAEFEAATPYYYSTYETSSDTQKRTKPAGKRKVIILGSGPIRIGQGIEFDYCTVHAVQALRAAGFETIVVNNNPETVSTDYDISDRLYFEPLRLEDVLRVIENEKDGLVGVMVQFGGQTAINLVEGIKRHCDARILGTPADSIDIASNRKRFKALAQSLGVPTVKSGIAFDVAGAVEAARFVGYPVLIRPSYVLGGRAMQVASDDSQLREKIKESFQVSEGMPVTIDHFLEGAIEIDVDIVGDGENYLVAGIMEQVEEVGVHSGDSSAMLPSRRLSPVILEKVRGYSLRLCSALKISGLCNIQMAARGEEACVIEVNPRASRTVPFVSKAIGIPIAKAAALAQVGITLKAQGLESLPVPGAVAVKAPVFPFKRFSGLVDCVTGSEMKSTGEVMAFGKTFELAYAKAILAAGQFPKGNKVFVGECGKWRKAIEAGARSAGFETVAGSRKDIGKLIGGGGVGLVVDGMGFRGGHLDNDSLDTRLKAVGAGVPVITSYFGALAFFDCIYKLGGWKRALQQAGGNIVSLSDAKALNQLEAVSISGGG